jgi:hypothetical protein
MTEARHTYIHTYIFTLLTPRFIQWTCASSISVCVHGAHVHKTICYAHSPLFLQQVNEFKLKLKSLQRRRRKNSLPPSIASIVNYQDLGTVLPTQFLLRVLCRYVHLCPSIHILSTVQNVCIMKYIFIS